MNYYIHNGTFYGIPSTASSGELYHYGVKGMKWGRRKALPIATGNARRPSANTDAEMAAKREARKAKAIKAAKIGAAVLGTALVAYGGYKLAKYMQGKRQQAAMKMASDYINNNVFRKVGDSTFKDGSRMMDFKNRRGDEITTRGSRQAVGKIVGQHNAKVVATGRQMYKDATSTRLDRGLAKVVNTGDAIGNAAKRAATNTANAAKNTVNKAKNAVLDAVDPIYEYKPGNTRVNTRTYDNGVKFKETVTNYYKTRKKR